MVLSIGKSLIRSFLEIFNSFGIIFFRVCSIVVSLPQSVQLFGISEDSLVIQDGFHTAFDHLPGAGFIQSFVLHQVILDSGQDRGGFGKIPGKGFLISGKIVLIEKFEKQADLFLQLRHVADRIHEIAFHAGGL